MSRRPDIDERARLEDQRRDLLASLDRVDAELRRGELDQVDHAELRDDLTVRTADVIRRLADTEVARPVATKTPISRRILVGVLIVIVAVAAGLWVRASSGLRLAGQFGSGQIEQSSRDLLLEAELEMAGGDLEAASETVAEVLELLPDDVDALVLLARIQERDTELLEAIMTLDAALAIEPDSTEALTLKGWILVRLPDEVLFLEGIRLLDRAIELQPRSFDVYWLRGITAANQGEPDAAVGYYRDALARNPPEAMVPIIESRIAELSGT